MTQSEEIKNSDRTIRAEILIRETKVLNIARLAKILVDLFCN